MDDNWASLEKSHRMKGTPEVHCSFGARSRSHILCFHASLGYTVRLLRRVGADGTIVLIYSNKIAVMTSTVRKHRTRDGFDDQYPRNEYVPRYTEAYMQGVE
jgi:hypothetical protein